ncbi:MAG: hypothetical protein RBS14_07385, partial [Atribacterota bacterium]|nr:hypothetical protein [Atribacterota bacterium]
YFARPLDEHSLYVFISRKKSKPWPVTELIVTLLSMKKPVIQGKIAYSSPIALEATLLASAPLFAWQQITSC